MPCLQFDLWQRRSWRSGTSGFLGSVAGSSYGTPPVVVRQPSSESDNAWNSAAADKSTAQGFSLYGTEFCIVFVDGYAFVLRVLILLFYYAPVYYAHTIDKTISHMMSVVLVHSKTLIKRNENVIHHWICNRGGHRRWNWAVANQGAWWTEVLLRIPGAKATGLGHSVLQKLEHFLEYTTWNLRSGEHKRPTFMPSMVFIYCSGLAVIFGICASWL